MVKRVDSVWKNEIGVAMSTDSQDTKDLKDQALWSWDDNPLGQLCANHFSQTILAPALWTKPENPASFTKHFLLQLADLWADRVISSH